MIRASAPEMSVYNGGQFERVTLGTESSTGTLPVNRHTHTTENIKHQSFEKCQRCVCSMVNIIVLICIFQATTGHLTLIAFVVVCLIFISE